MASLTFDRHEFIKDLVASGFEEGQAEVISAGILRAHEMANLATKSDVQMAQAQTDAKIDRVASGLDAKIDRVAAELDAKINKVASELDAKINKVAAELDAKIDKLDAKIDKEIIEVKSDLKLLKWMMGVTVAGTMAIFIQNFFGG